MTSKRNCPPNDDINTATSPAAEPNSKRPRHRSATSISSVTSHHPTASTSTSIQTATSASTPASGSTLGSASSSTSTSDSHPTTSTPQQTNRRSARVRKPTSDQSASIPSSCSPAIAPSSPEFFSSTTSDRKGKGRAITQPADLIQENFESGKL